MESRVKVRSGWCSMDRFFKDNSPYIDTRDWLLVKHVKHTGNGWYDVVVRHPEFERSLSGRSFKSIGGLVHALEGEYWKGRCGAPRL
jgi:hypothetical protein